MDRTGTAGNYWTRRVARRGVVRAGVFGSAGLIGAALIGCGNDAKPTANNTTALAAGGSAAAAVRRGGKLLLSDIPQTQDLHRHSGTMPTPSLVADTPTAIDANGATQNFLLDGVEAPDASTYTFKFKQGVKFHNGREMTSEDVRQNFARIKATKGAWLKSVADGIDTMTMPDKNTITVKLSSPYSPMTSLISEMWLMAPESPGWDSTITTPIGTGPFVWKQWIPNDKIVLERFPDYWRKGQPYIDAIDIKNLKGDTTPALLAGDIHMTGVSRDQRKLIGSNPVITFQQEKATSWQFLSFNNRKARAPYTDIRVRQAMGYALDKSALNEFANGDTGTVADQMAPPKSFYWSDKVVDPFAKRDIAKAKQLLQAAGIAPGQLKPVMPVNSSPREPEAVAAQLKEAGIAPDLQVADDIATETRLQSYDWDIYYAGSGPRSDIALRYVRLMSDGPNPGLWGGPQDPEFDRLVKAAWTLVDGEARKAKYLEAWKIAMDKLFTIVVYHKAGTTAVRKEAGGWQTGAVANFNRIDGGVSFVQIQA